MRDESNRSERRDKKENYKPKAQKRDKLLIYTKANAAGAKEDAIFLRLMVDDGDDDGDIMLTMVNRHGECFDGSKVMVLTQKQRCFILQASDPAYNTFLLSPFGYPSCVTRKEVFLHNTQGGQSGLGMLDDLVQAVMESKSSSNDSSDNDDE